MGERGAANVTFEEIEFRDWLEMWERKGGGGGGGGVMP